LGPHEAVAHELRHERRRTVVAKAAGMDRRRDEVMAERVHRDERRQPAGIAEVVCEEAAGQRRARSRLTREQVDVPAGELLAEERKREAGEVRAAAEA